MRLFNVVAMLVAVCFIWANAQDNKIVVPKSETGVYTNHTRNMNEQPVIMITPTDRLVVISTKGNFYQVKTNAGVIGWVEKSKVVAMGKSKTFKFEDAEVIGYLDNPTPVYILDSDDPNAERIYLNRSFKEALRDNIDKETVERQVK